jgi:hypothetical protein
MMQHQVSQSQNVTVNEGAGMPVQVLWQVQWTVIDIVTTTGTAGKH